MLSTPLGRTLAAAALVVGLAPARPAGAQGDDAYRFVAGRSEGKAVSLAANGTGVTFAWPATKEAAWDTALVSARVTAEEGAAEPWVEMVAGSARAKLYLDPQAKGLRWLNLSTLKPQLAVGASVEIQAHGVAIEAGAASLRVFANRLDLAKRILIVAPHPDDAEIASFGLYSGRNASIVTVTSGNAGDANYADDFPDMAEQYLFKGYIRAVDSVTVPWQGGIPPERCLNLGYFDARLKTMHGKPNEIVPELYGPNTDVAPYRRANVSRLVSKTSGPNRWSNVVDDLLEVLKKVKPQIIVMPYPQLDTHADHQYASVALVAALERYKEPATFLLYTNHAFRNLYPFGPAGTGMSLPPFSALELPVESVFSHPVSPALQRRKLYALESMHDLRLSPTEQNGCLPPGTPAKRPDYPRIAQGDYFRRGPRAEEVFFVYGRDAVKDLIREFLKKESAQ
jgi:hypothetical protein